MLAAVEAEDLDPFSDEELRERITRLEAETERCRRRLDFSKSHRAAADALFKSD